MEWKQGVEWVIKMKKEMTNMGEERYENASMEKKYLVKTTR